MSKLRHEPTLCPFNNIALRVPRKMLVECAMKKRHLTWNERVALRGFVYRGEATINKVMHAISLAERGLRKEK